jgi:hypothetical protein
LLACGRRSSGLMRHPQKNQKRRIPDPDRRN